MGQEQQTPAGRPRSWQPRGLMLLPVALACCLALAGCAQGPPDEELPPPVVTVATPVYKEVIDYSNFTGRTAAVSTNKIQARVSGYLDEVYFKDGDLVKKTNVLFQIDRRVFAAQRDSAAAKVELYKASLKLATSNYEQYVQLAKVKGAVSKLQLNQYQAEKDQAAANLKAAQADLQLAETNLDFTKVRAPVTGRVSRKMIDKGNLVKADDTVLTTIVTQDPIYAYFDVDDLTFMRVNKLFRQVENAGRSGKLPVVLMGLPTETGYPHQGEIDFVDNQVDPGTGTVKIRGIFANKDGAITPADDRALSRRRSRRILANKDGAITPGLYVRVSVPLGDAHPAVLISDSAIDTDQGQKVVYVVNKENKIETRKVKLGGLHDGLRELVSGVRPGERVVVVGLQRVREGIVVNPQSPDPAEQDPMAPAAK